MRVNAASRSAARFGWSARGRPRRRLRLAGELMITAGAVLLLFVVYELGVTSWLTAASQDRASAALAATWSEPGPEGPPVPGRPMARLYVPAFGSGWVRTVSEGVDAATLNSGPGHYPGAAVPGEPGNVAIAAHRVGRGAPFDPLDRLESCDALVLETRTAWWIYRVLPMADERGDWGAVQAAQPACRDVIPLPTPYDATVGRRVVAPTATDVVAPVPGVAAPVPNALPLITLTTCHPRFSARQRLVVHGVLVDGITKKPGDPPPAVLGQG